MTEVNLPTLQAFFLKAMLSGWVNNGQYNVIPNLPGHKLFEYRECDLFLTDIYCTNNATHQSAGTTTIYHKNQPVWIMQYHGYYEKRAIRLLKEILSKTYGGDEFIGGRGPAVFSMDGLTYTNVVQGSGFSEFSGREQIVDNQASISLGFHEYFGKLLT